MANKQEGQPKQVLCEVGDCDFSVDYQPGEEDTAMDLMREHNVEAHSPRPPEEAAPPVEQPTGREEPTRAESSPPDLTATFKGMTDAFSQVAVQLQRLGEEQATTRQLLQQAVQMGEQAQQQGQPPPNSGQQSGFDQATGGQPLIGEVVAPQNGAQQQQVVSAPQPQQGLGGIGVSEIIAIAQALGMGKSGGGDQFEALLGVMDKMARFSDGINRITAPKEVERLNTMLNITNLLKTANQAGIETGATLDQLEKTTREDLERMKQYTAPRTQQGQPNA